MPETMDKQLDLMSTEYTHPTPDRVVDQKLIGYIARYVVERLRGDNILELGVGDQIWTPMLIEKFSHVTSIDASTILLEHMARKVTATNWRYVCTYFEDYEPQDRFDTVLATYVLEHIDDPLAVLKRARQHWLKDGGRIAIVVPHALSLHRRLAVILGMNLFPGQLGETDLRVGHKQVFSCYEMEELLVEAGFRVIEKKGMLCKVLPNRMLTECSDEQLEGLFKLGLELPIEYSGAIYLQAETR